MQHIKPFYSTLKVLAFSFAFNNFSVLLQLSAIIWALSGENLSSGFPTKWYSNQPAQLQRLARKSKYRLLCSQSRYDTFQKANNKGADQTARMRRLVCAFVVCKPPNTGFLESRPISHCSLAGISEAVYQYLMHTCFIRNWHLCYLNQQ